MSKLRMSKSESHHGQNQVNRLGLCCQKGVPSPRGSAPVRRYSNGELQASKIRHSDFVILSLLGSSPLVILGTRLLKT